MPEPTPDQNLHLPSLVIKNFRGIDELTVPRLGRVTLLTGKNGVGKTTVLDAVRVWAARGRRSVFDSVLIDRGDSFTGNADDRPDVLVDRIALFTNRDFESKVVISIGTDGNTVQLVESREDAYGHPLTGSLLNDTVDNIGIQLRIDDDGSPRPTVIETNILGPNGPTDEFVERHWHDIALSAHEDRAVEALNLIANFVVERVAVVDPIVESGRSLQRRLMAKVKGKDYPVPLRSLGDGAVRCFAVALSLAKSTDGILLIDEAENGIHHSIQAKFWNMVLKTAHRNNVQVIATTHSWDCVAGFAQAANELEDVEGVLYRIQRNGDRLRAVEYPEETLRSAAKHGIEVR